MSSIIQYSLLLLGGLLVLVSSFSTRLPSCGFNQNNYRNDCSPLSLGVSHPYEQKRGFPLILSMSSQVATTEDSQEVRGLFSKYCDKDSLIDRKTLESMPPFADMMVSELVRLFICWCALHAFLFLSSRTELFSHSFLVLFLLVVGRGGPFAGRVGRNLGGGTEIFR